MPQRHNCSRPGIVERKRLGVVFECRVRNADSTSVQRRDSTMQRLRHFYKSDTDNWAFEDDTGPRAAARGGASKRATPSPTFLGPLATFARAILTATQLMAVREQPGPLVQIQRAIPHRSSTASAGFRFAFPPGWIRTPRVGNFRWTR